MTVTFRTTTLGSHVDTQKGFAFKSKWYSDTGRPIVRVSNFTEDSVDVEQLVCVPEEIAQKYLRHELREGDVVVQTVGSWPSNPQSVVGKTVRIPRTANASLLNQNAVQLKPDKTLDKRYLFYLLRSPQFKNYIVGTAQGAASQAAITLDSIRNFVFKHPDLTAQHRIAAILSAYGALIENNLRRIKILEEMAQAIYREWFVRFRFPGYEKVKMVDSELGKIPEGWQTAKVADSFEILGGGTPSKKVNEYWDGGEIVWYTPSDLTKARSMFMDNSSSRITELGLEDSSAHLFPPYAVMMTSRATIGVVAINTTPAATNQGFIVCLPNQGFPLYYLYFWLVENTDTFLNMASGTTFKEISKTVFKTIPLLSPQSSVLQRFEKLVQTIGQQVLNFQRQIANLRQTRDLLLPKLISGQLDVSDLDIKVAQESP